MKIYKQVSYRYNKNGVPMKVSFVKKDVSNIVNDYGEVYDIEEVDTVEDLNSVEKDLLLESIIEKLQELGIKDA